MLKRRLTATPDRCGCEPVLAVHRRLVFAIQRTFELHKVLLRGMEAASSAVGLALGALDPPSRMRFRVPLSVLLSFDPSALSLASFLSAVRC